ncbi:VOC family protein [Riemerella columbina]|uniref:VOC family protein n=1 Tax=Riemerella columbina TaxID=103810 RepID=UPI003F689AF6
MALSADSKEEADDIFAKLAEGGTITMPLMDTFWGDYFGMLTDRFGIQWMMSFDKNKK